MKYTYIAFLLLAGLLFLAAPTQARPEQNITHYVATNHTIVFADGRSLVLQPPMPKQPTAPERKYPLPHWMPKPFDGTSETCNMGLIGKNTRGQNVCYRPHRGR